MMTTDHKALWDKIEAFDFDHPLSEYGFSTRLAKENYWTKHFTRQAILEYKKFMFLAATSDLMVSPSAIVDTVWHQHLIFTQSYQSFCNLLGKQIQHIPSTHNREDFPRFKQAKERTALLYEAIFGKQPHAIWGYDDMYESLNLQKAKFKLRTAVLIGIFVFVVLAIPFYFLLRPVYVHIGNPYFMLGFLGLAIGTFLGLEYYSSFRLKQLVRGFDKDSFVYSLQPYELIYLETGELSKVINGEVNALVDNNVIVINSNNTIELFGNSAAESLEQLQISWSLSQTGRTYYSRLMNQLIRKPVFWNIRNSMEAFKKYVNKSLKFGQLFYFNFGVLAVLLLLAFTRLVTGILRDKPVGLIAFTVIALLVLIFFYLNRLTKLFGKRTIPELYRKEILPVMRAEHDWQWRYFLVGTTMLTTSFIPLANYTDSHSDFGSGSTCGGTGGGSCGSSCGSSCSSCGGCGGGD